MKGGGFGPYLKCIWEGGSHHFLSWSGWTLLRVDGFPAIDKPSQMVYNIHVRGKTVRVGDKQLSTSPPKTLAALNHLMSSFMDLLGNVITQTRFVNVSLEM